MQAVMTLRESVLGAWRTNDRVTRELLQALPAALWDVRIPGTPRKTVRDLGAHLHNARCAWLRILGREHGIPTPERVDRRVAPRRLAAALNKSSLGMEALLELGLANDGRVPPSKAYVWRNLALDVGHVLTYFVAHEAHHRGQIVMLARETGLRLPPSIHAGLWHWKPR